jgi:glycine/D-amino acid oxidase-like deaminating enzyme
MKGSITQKEDLLAGKPVWANSRVAKLTDRKLPGSIKCDVVIVGAGISGAFMARALSKIFDSVIVLDRREPIHGSTSASTAMLQFEIDTPLTELAQKIGDKPSARAWRRSYAATQDLIKLVQHEGIRCGLQPRDALYLAGNRLGSRGLKHESRARNLAGLPGEYLNAPALKSRFGIERTGAILSPDSAIANPVQLAAGLLRRAIQNGVKLYSPVTVSNVLAAGHGVVVDTGEHFVQAKYCVFCTGYELVKGIPEKGVKITSSWAIATKEATRYPAWLDRTVVWEASDPYLYMRTTPDRRLVIGGEDEDRDSATHRARSIAGKSKRLAAKAKTLVPGLGPRITHRWTGAFGESNDGLPIIDEIPGMPNCFAAMGLGGNGTIYSMIAAQIVPTLMTGKRDKDADLFSFR